jgi:hypothetical protein
MTKFRAACPTQAAVGWTVVPSTRTRRVACSMTARMYWRCPVSVTVSMKSHASSASAWLRRNAAQVVAVRSGAGLMPCYRVTRVSLLPLIPSARVLGS